MPMLLQALRIIDANLNRSSEGLRLLEDVARFILNDATLSQQLKAIRHDLAEETKSLGVKLLSHRDSEHDVGANLTLTSQLKGEAQRDLPGVITANAKRVEESLRVIEELAKLPQISPMLNPAKFEQARFTLYTLEQRLTSRILRQDKVKQLAGIYVILDRQALAGRDEITIGEQVIQGGAKVIQLRDKQASKAELLPIAKNLKGLCDKYGILFIINDYLDLALAVDADGLHIGQKDLPLPIVRHTLPIDKIVGCSVTTVSQAIKAQSEGADYIAVGSVFPTKTKGNAVVVGVAGLKQIRQAVTSPLIAIGGINEDNISQVMAAGADSAAVISAVLGQEDVKKAVQQLLAGIDLAGRKCQN
ncbi:MAG TPA: thiamine phosphate synthase [Dehalococcoidia bacterium]|nr:thiamine phosphate synthase [Dehalococcoidia bacterium]